MEHRTFHRILAAIIAVLIVLAGYGVYYVNDYHHAINVGNAIQSNPTVKVTDIEDGWLFDGPGTTTAMVFYPGAKVEASAYAPYPAYCFVAVPSRLAGCAADAGLRGYGSPSHGNGALHTGTHGETLR